MKRLLTHRTEKLASRIGLFTLTAALSVITLACSSSKETSSSNGLQLPKVYSSEIIDQYRSLANDGYQALNAGDEAKAVGSFTAQMELVPEGKLGAYNLACVYGRTGNLEKGLHWLKESVNSGWANPDDLLNDSDLASLKDSPEFEKLVAQSKANLADKDKMFAHGLPDYSTPPQTFSTPEELNAWTQAQSDILKANAVIWHDWQYAAASLDFYARRLAAEQELRKGDSTYDSGLYRVRTIGNIKTIWDCWGSLSDGVVKEAQAYLATSPPPPAADEANYLAGLALVKKLCDDEPSAEQTASINQAQAYFAKVSEKSSFSGSASAWIMAHKLATANEEGPEEVQALYADLRTLIDKCREDDDKDAMRIISVGFHSDAVNSIWPLDLNQPDFKGKNVTLADYKGKVVLVDFWATWCGPCLAELPNVKSVYKEYHSQGLEIISVSLDYDSRVTTKQLRKWTAEKEMNWRHIYEGKGWNISLADRFLVKSIPAMFLVDRKGNLVAMGEDLHGENLGATVKKAIIGNVH